MNRTVIGVLAHVDAGKTTLSEAMLYISGTIRTLGRVDHGSAFLDTFAMERQRGITIFSKQAALDLSDSLHATLLDTPGHADFSAETERTLDVLDCAVMVISAPAGIQSHTMTLWRLLRRKHIPTFLFINKTDLPAPSRTEILQDLRRTLGEGFADFSDPDTEAMAMGSEALLEEYLETGELSENSILRGIRQGELFPCWFGSALKLEGVEDFMAGLAKYAPAAEDSGQFGAKVFKISRDEQGVRLTHLRVTGGCLRVRDTLSGDGWSEKITQLRVYNGARFRPAEEAFAGDVVAAVGLTCTYSGQGLGVEAQSTPPVLEPVLTYRVILPDGCDIHRALEHFRLLEEEDPLLHVDWSAQLQEIRVRLMGPIQLEILQQQLKERFDLAVAFGQGGILYKETIADAVEGVGHYEPLRHYAEVHLLLEPAPRGSGIRFRSACHPDDLAINWQRLIMGHLSEKQHLGVLTGSPITDMTITLLSGKAHLKHTEGGDFRQSTYRAVRQGLMQAESILLEPWYRFRLEVPQNCVGRAMTDLEQMGARFDPPETLGDTTLLQGSGPVSALQDYPRTVTVYTHGVGRFSCEPDGYAPCKNQEQIVSELSYDPEADMENPTGSVFCDHGAGFYVNWQDVPKYMHLPSALTVPSAEPEMRDVAAEYHAMTATDKELLAIFERTYGPIRRDFNTAFQPARHSLQDKTYKTKPQPQGPEYLLVDGYNIIFAWDELKNLARDDLDLARTRLMERLRNYQGYRQHPVIVVFDAYKVKNNPGSVEHFGDLSVVYTKEAETADMYIERVTHELGKKHKVRVATSDSLEQVIILGHGAQRVSADNFHREVELVEQSIREHLNKKP